MMILFQPFVLLNYHPVCLCPVTVKFLFCFLQKLVHTHYLYFLPYYLLSSPVQMPSVLFLIQKLPHLSSKLPSNCHFHSIFTSLSSTCQQPLTLLNIFFFVKLCLLLGSKTVRLLFPFSSRLADFLYLVLFMDLSSGCP